MQLDSLSTKDVELVVVGGFSLVLAGLTVVGRDRSINLVALSLFVFLAAVSFGLVFWDVRTRSDSSSTDT